MPCLFICYMMLSIVKIKFIDSILYKNNFYYQLYLVTEKENSYLYKLICWIIRVYSLSLECVETAVIINTIYFISY